MPTLIYIILCLAIVAVLIKPLGKYIAGVYIDKLVFPEKILGWLERLIYKTCGIAPEKEMNWVAYTFSLILFSFFCFLLLFFILCFQHVLPLNPQQFPAVSPDLAFNLAIGFITNCDWQVYAGENTLSNFSQTIGLTVQNFIATASGMAIFAALARGIARRETKFIGNFYKDMVRGIIYILLPLSLILSVFLVSQGVVQSFSGYVSYTPLQDSDNINSSPESRTLNPESLIPLGAVASQVAIRTVGSSGGGFFGANGAHPFENPTPLSNFIQIIATLILPSAFAYAFGCIVGDSRQGWALLATMYIIFLPMLGISVYYEQKANPLFDTKVIDGSAGNMEGKDVRFGIGSSTFRVLVAAASSNGSPNAMLDSFSPIGGLVPIILTQFSELIIGGVGSGVYNILTYVILTVFLGGLMVGRTPQYLGKKITTFDIKMASVVVVVPAMVVLLGTAIAVTTQAGRDGVFNSGAQGFTEILYAYTSAGNNDGGAFAGLKANTPFYNISLAIAMFIGRFFITVAILGLAGSFAGKNIAPANAGTLPTHTPLFIFLLIWVLVTVGILAFIPSVIFGPVAEHFHLNSLIPASTVQ